LFGLVYLSNERKRQLSKLNERLAHVADPRTHRDTELMIQEIMAEAKPYTKCDIYEVNELRNQIMDQISVLRNLGKSQSVESFQMHLRDIEFHLQTLQMAEVVKEKAILKRDEGSNLVDRTPTISPRVAATKRRAMGRTRWQIGMDDEVEGQNIKK
jgi:hypothetical protein